MSTEPDNGARKQQEHRRQHQARYSDFLACRWEAREEPVPGMAIKIDPNREEPVTSPIARPFTDVREEPVYIVVARQKSAEGQYVRPFGHIASDSYKTFDEAFQEAADRNRDYRLSEEPLQNRVGEQLQAAPEINHELAMYAQAGLMVVSPDKTEAVSMLVRHWDQRGGTEKPEEHLIVVDRKTTVNEINRMCQLTRRSQDTKEAFQRTDVIDRAGNSLYAGDRIVFFGDHIEESLRVCRGTLMPTENPQSLTVKLDNGNAVEISAQEAHAVIELGYAVTTEHPRLDTAEHAHVLVEEIDGREQDVSYTHSHDPTNTTIFIDQQKAGWELKQIAEQGLQHGELIRQWWKSQYIESQQAREQTIKINRQQEMDLGRDVM